MPPRNYHRPDRVDLSGLVASPVDQYGEPLGPYDFTESAGPEEFRRVLVAAFVERGRQRWNSRRSYATHAKQLRSFMRWAAELDPPLESVAEMTPSHWSQWRLHGGKWSSLGGVLGEAPELAEVTRAAVTARTRRPKPKLKKSYTRADLKAIRTTAAKTVRAARLRIAQNTALLERWQTGQVEAASEEEPWGRLLNHLALTGDLPRQPCGQLHDSVKQLTRAEGFAGAVTRLFPSEQEMGAAAILLVCHEAWNLSVLQRMPVPDYWPNADQSDVQPVIHQVDTDKPRRGRRRRHGTNNLVNTGQESAGWAMQQVLEMTARTRATLALIGPPTTSLFVGRRLRASAQGGFCDGMSLEWAIRSWAIQAEREDTGFPRGVAASTVRHAVQVVHGGPRNNTLAVHRDAYLMQDEGVREEAGEVVANALADVVAQARAQVRMRVVGQAIGHDDHVADQVAKQTGLGLEAAGEVVAGRLDTAVAACTDFEHSPFTLSGPCTVSFLLCFACPNALATGRHLPRITYLATALEALRSAVSATVWAADWTVHHARVNDLLDRYTTEEGRPALLAQLDEREKDLVDRMLERRLDP